MVTLKYDLRQSDPDKAKKIGAVDQPQPGIYRFQIVDVLHGYSKNGDGSEDKSRGRAEIVFGCLDKKYEGAQVWLYIPDPDSTSRNQFSDQKMDQLLQAVGYTDGKKNRTGTLNADKVLRGKTVKLKVRGGANNEGVYRAEYGAVFPDDGELADDDNQASMLDDELLDEDEPMESEDEMLAEDDGEYPEAERMEALAQASAADLKALAKELGVAVGGKTKSVVVDLIIAAEREAWEGGTTEDEMVEDETVEATPDDEYLTREQLMAMDRNELAKTASDFDIKPGGMKRSQVVDAILEAQAADEEPF